MTENEPAQPPSDDTGQVTRSRREQFILGIFLNAGLQPDPAERLLEQSLETRDFMEQLVDSLVTFGVFQPEGELYERVTIEDLGGLEPTRDFFNHLERKRLSCSLPEHWCRLGRLYGISGEAERAALAHRTCFGLMPEMTPELLVSICEGTDPAVDRPLALGCIDRIAEIVLTGDQALDSPDRQDMTSDDPAGCAVLLDRAGLAALRVGEPGRAASLSRAATALFERTGLRSRLQSALANLAVILRESGDLAGALKTLERRRTVLSAESDFGNLARCHRDLAEVAEARGELNRAAHHLEKEIELYESIVEPTYAAAAARALGEFNLRHGQVDDAAEAFERARELAEDELVDRALAQVALVETWRAMGTLSTALAENDEALRRMRDTDESLILAQLLLNRAAVLVRLGRYDDAELALNEALATDPGARSLPDVGMVEALSAAYQGRADQDLPRIREAFNEALEDEDQSAAAELALAAAASLDAKAESPRVLWLRDAVKALDDLGLEHRERIALIRARLAGSTDEIVDVFERAALSDLAFLRLESAVALARAHADVERFGSATRPVTSALRSLGDLLARLEPEHRESFIHTPLVAELLDVARTVRGSLRQIDSKDDDDHESTARLSPGFVIDGLFISISRHVELPGHAAMVADSGGTARHDASTLAAVREAGPEEDEAEATARYDRQGLAEVHAAEDDDSEAGDESHAD